MAIPIGGIATTVELRLPGGVAAVASPDFHAEQYLRKLRQVIPVQQLRVALEREVGEVRRKLKELVNEAR